MPRTLDLRTGAPVWTAFRAPSVPHASLTRDLRTEVLVVGMGISGAMVAESLTAAGFRVAMIDRRGPLLGSTPASTALVQFEIDVPLTRLTPMVGRAQAEQAWRRARLAVDNLSSCIDSLGIDCGKTARSSLLLAGNSLGAGDLRAEAAARRAAGLSSDYLTRGMLCDRFGIRRAGAVLSPGNFAVDPRKLTAGLLLRAMERGARLYAPVRATSVESSRQQVEVATEHGPIITADSVVLATGYELMDIVPKGAHRIISTFAIATRRQPRALWPEQALIWEASNPYLYLRTTQDGRIICGGEDVPFADESARDALIPSKALRLSTKLARLLPLVDTQPVFAWAGAFGLTRTGLPLIGALPGYPRVSAVMSYGGNGITFARIAAELLCTQLMGATDTDAALFAFKD